MRTSSLSALNKFILQATELDIASYRTENCMKELAYFFCRESQQASAYIYIYGTCNAYHIFGQCPGIYVVTPGVTTRWFSYDGEEDTPRELYYNKNLSDMI